MRLNFFRKRNTAIDKNYIPKDTYLKIVDFLKGSVDENTIIVCIGTNRTEIVDCLGPLVGSILKEDREFNIPVYGSIIDPIHGMNLTKRITDISNNHPNKMIIAVDAALSYEDTIGMIRIKKGPLKPGIGVDNNFEEVGDISIRGIVAPMNIKIFEYGSDLNFIMAMARTIAKGLKETFM